MVLRSAKIIAAAALLLFGLSLLVQVRALSERLGPLKQGLEAAKALEAGVVPVIEVDFTKEISSISDQVFGQGLEMPFLDGIWEKDKGFDPEALEAAREIGFTNLRFGGATCRDFNWRNEAMTGYRPYRKTYFEGIDEWQQYAKLLAVPAPTICTNIHLKPEDSADWVRYANLEKGYDIINWELGNEEYLAYTDVNAYLSDARAHCAAMKAADPRVRCGLVGDEKGVSWTNDQLLSLVRPGEFDFFVAHFYQPESHYSYYPLYEGGQIFSKQLNLGAGRQRFDFYAIGDQAPETSDPWPTLKVCLDDDCTWVDVTNTERGKWVKYSTRDFSVQPGPHKLSIQLADDYYNAASRQDKNIFVANASLVGEDGGATKLDFIDVQAWTASFLASNLSTEDALQGIRRSMERHGLALPIYVTEYGWSYGTEAYPNWGLQYDWRSTLFDALHLQSLIKQGVPQANIWKDLATGYWKYFSRDAKGQIHWPIFPVFKLLAGKTGDILVATSLENMPAYDAQAFRTEARQGVPYLSVMASKRGDTNYLNVVNRSQERPIMATIKTNVDYVSVRAYEVAPSSLESHPYRDDQHKESLEIKEKTIVTTGPFNYEFKPFSVTTFEFKVAAPMISGARTMSLPSSQRATVLRLSTDKPAECRYATAAGQPYDEMKGRLATADGSSHTLSLSGLAPGRTHDYFVKCRNRAGSANLADYRLTVKVAPPVKPNTCLITPDGGNYFAPMAVTVACGQGVKAASYKWDQGRAVGFNEAVTATFAADRKRTLEVRYAYQASVRGQAADKTVVLNKVFDANQRYCRVEPNGGSFTGPATVRIECGREVKRATWQWDRGPVYAFGPTTEIKFAADRSRSLNISFAYDQPKGSKLEEKIARFSKGFTVPSCVDSDQGKAFDRAGQLTYTGQTIQRRYADSCSGPRLTEYYCDARGRMAYVVTNCPAGCSQGRCR